MDLPLAVNRLLDCPDLSHGELDPETIERIAEVRMLLIEDDTRALVY